MAGLNMVDLVRKNAIVENGSGAFSVFPTASNTWGDFTSINLAPGRWKIEAYLITNLNGATMSYSTLGIGKEPGTSIVGITNLNSTDMLPPTASYNVSGIVYDIVDIDVATTFYLKCRAGYSAGTPNRAGKITATLIGK